MKEEDILHFNPDVLSIFLHKLENAINIYLNYYFPKLSNKVHIKIKQQEFEPKRNFYDVVLTSPPYGDSKTTVAYGQFSALSNEWMGISYARKIDNMLMGGKKAVNCFKHGIISDYVRQIDKIDHKRALEVSSFYTDLGNSIKKVAQSVASHGKSIYIVGNRTVKDITLPTDQFIAEQFQNNGFNHLVTYQRMISNKSMPKRNSPTNKKGKSCNTMLWEYIVICEKV